MVTQGSGEGYETASTKSFKELFPTVEEILIEVDVREEGVGQSEPRSVTYTLKTIPGPMIPCPCAPNACKGGGYRIAGHILAMTTAKDTEGSFRGPCEGSEPMGRHSSRKCFAYFTVKITITYKSA